MGQSARRRRRKAWSLKEVDDLVDKLALPWREPVGHRLPDEPSEHTGVDFRGAERAEVIDESAKLAGLQQHRVVLDVVDGCHSWHGVPAICGRKTRRILSFEPGSAASRKGWFVSLRATAGCSAGSWICAQTSYRIGTWPASMSTPSLGRASSRMRSGTSFCTHGRCRTPLSPIAVAGGEGRFFWDDNGKRYLDFDTQLVNIGLGDEHRDRAAIEEQAATLYDRAHGHRVRARLGRGSRRNPGDLNKAFFTHGGAEANENAIKVAGWYTGRNKIIARYRATTAGRQVDHPHRRPAALVWGPESRASAGCSTPTDYRCNFCGDKPT